MTHLQCHREHKLWEREEAGRVLVHEERQLLQARPLTAVQHLHPKVLIEHVCMQQQLASNTLHDLPKGSV